MRKRLARGERNAELDARRQVKTAAHVTQTLGEMKGLAMKFGQVASFTAGNSTPEPWQEALAKLQQDAPPMSAAMAARVVKQELGAAPTDVFREWNPVPIGSASIGQVHRAVTLDGTDVAVKVQYPDADGALSADVDTIATVARVAVRKANRQAEDDSAKVDPTSAAAMLEVFKARLVQETDYAREATNQELIAAAFEGRDRIHVPRVIRELSSAHVLTTTLAHGSRFGDVLGWEQHERDLIGETLFRFHMECVFQVGHHNADPHPGNYIFNPGGHVTFLDFGALWDVSREFVDGVPRLVELLSRDRAVLDETGADGSRRKDKAPFGALLSLGWLYEFVVVKGERAMPAMKAPRPDQRSPVYDFNDEEASFVREMATAIGNSASALIGVQAVLATLGASRDWSAIARDVL